MDRIFYMLFLVLSSAQHWLMRRFTAAGRFVLACLVASAAIGLDTNLTMAYQVFTLLLSLLAVSFASHLFIRTRVEARRTLPQFGTAGQPLAYRIVVSSKERRMLRGLFLAEDLADPRPSYQEFDGASWRTAKRHSLPGGPFGYSRWRQQVDAKRIADIKEQTVDAVSHKGDCEVRVEFVPMRRGVVRFEGMTISRPDPFGLVKGGVTLPLRQSLLVLPKRYSVPLVRLPGMRVYQQGGVSLAGSIGDSEEFVSLREYRPGDPLRKVHWKSWARTGRPVVKEFQEEFFVRHALVLDTFRAGVSPAVFEAAVSVAASFVCTVETQESLLDLLFVGAELYCVTVGRGVGRMEQALETLASVRPCEDRPFEDLRTAVMERAASVSGCICILLSWDDERKRLINGLRGLGIPVLTIVISDPAAPSTERLNLTRDDVRLLEVGNIQEGLASL
jgi:uncharacterized protein (DUF58 family)